MSGSHRTIRLGEHDAGRRLDRVLRRILEDLPLGRIYSAIRKGEIRVSGHRRTSSYRLQPGDVLEVPVELAPAAGDAPRHDAPRQDAALPTDLADRVIYENEHILAIDKPAGTPVHGRDGLLARLRPYLSGGEQHSVSFRPGPIHRLDRNTSGLMLFPKSLRGSQRASELLRERRLAKGYLAVLSGHLNAVEQWDDVLLRDERRRVSRVDTPGDLTGGSGPAGGGSRNSRASATVAPLGWSETETLALVHIETGRTHQIRAQAAARGYPLAGDRKYGGPAAREAGYLLHAVVLLNLEPDSVFPSEQLCAPPRSAAWQAYLSRLKAAQSGLLEDCGRIAAELSSLVYKSDGRAIE